MKDLLKAKKAVAAAVVAVGLIVLLGAVIVGWIVDRNSSSCPPDYATGFNLEGDTWCIPKSEFCEMLLARINEDGDEYDEAAFQQICAEFEEPDE